MLIYIYKLYLITIIVHLIEIWFSHSYRNSVHRVLIQVQIWIITLIL